MNGFGYEEKCARYLRAQGFHKVEVTRQSGDQGVDLLASRHGKKYAVQCKYYSHPVGNHAVMEAYAGAKYYGCHKAIVMTNQSFTTSAVNLSRQTDVVLWPECSARKGILGGLARPMGKMAAIASILLVALIWWNLAVKGLMSGLEWGMAAAGITSCICHLMAGRSRISIFVAALCEVLIAWMMNQYSVTVPPWLAVSETWMIPVGVCALSVLQWLCLLSLSPIPRSVRIQL